MHWPYVLHTVLAARRVSWRRATGSLLLTLPVVALAAAEPVMTPPVAPAAQTVSPSAAASASAPSSQLVSAAPAALAPATPLAVTSAVPARPIIHGWVEWASLEPEDLQLEAKFDTGAETSSLDADHLRLNERDGQEYATFELRASQDGHAVTRTLSYPVTRWVKIRSAAGVDRRPVVRMQVCVGTQTIDAEFSLRDRGEMTYQLLLGRRAISLFGPVDAGHTHLLGTCRQP